MATSILEMIASLRSLAIFGNNVDALQVPDTDAPGQPTVDSDRQEMPKGRLIDFLEQPHRFVPGFDTITGYLEPADIKTQWNINSSLRKFFQNPVNFRNKLGEAAAIISGNFVLDFLDRRATGDRMDIFFHSYDWEPLNECLVQEGYVDTDVPWSNDPRSQFVDPNEDEFGDLYWHKLFTRSRPNAEPLQVHLHGANGTPLACLLSATGNQHSTAFSNFITATTVYSPFARETFLDYRSYQHGKTRREQCGHTLNAIASTGRKTLQHRLTADKNRVKHRKFTDGETWRMVLQNEGIKTPTTPDYVMDATTFKIEASWNCGFSTVTQDAGHPVLEHAWVSSHWDHLKPILQGLLEIEFYKTPRKKWGSTLDATLTRDEILATIDRDDVDALPFHVSTFYDDMMLEWIRHVEEEGHF
ncbi:hypothetical protein BU16DRAFT_554048 [Lophium mytilinum]|uniref:Uncharacterized protein n=1 Tax=Lophium mytilinum TaxID=390894 RepID=A0A6A6RE25_9PEZI|nr:hypothetical protein BU16DRAFT_554048 [Lophium mytilinum]